MTEFKRTKSKKTKSKSIRSRLIIGFVFLAFLIALIFSLFNFMLVYVVEDSFIDGVLNEEGIRIEQVYKQEGRYPSLSREYFQLYLNQDALPEEIKRTLLKEPERIEVPGEEGRHYHIYRSNSEPSFILVAEVSQILVVRPIREAIIIMLSVFSGLMILFSILLGYWLANKTVRPLTDLSRLVAGSTPEKLPENFSNQFGTDEVGVLASALEGAIKEIHEYIEREKSFSRDASHELRTPITAVLGASEILLESDLNNKDKEVVSRVNRAAKQMEVTVNSLLTLARVETTQEEKSKVKVLPLVERIVIDNAALLEGKAVEVDINISSNEKLACTEGLLNILLSNLISNAFQYTTRGVVNISCENHEIKVSDSGSGIEKDIIENVTDNLVKGKSSKGFGIGLSIVKKICEYQNLNLEISTDSNGTEIVISF